MASAPSAKRVVLGVSASIAAYKAAELASGLVQAGIDVYPILTRDATRFIGPDTLRGLTGHPCPVDIFDEPVPGEIGHIWLAQQCDLIAIVPASMDIIARLAHGLANDMLTGTVMASDKPLLLAPGMNTKMWAHPATQANLVTLSQYGYYFVEPVSGRLACRTEGVGKMADVATIHAAILELLERGETMRGRQVLVTAGPTREPLDPVRYLSNRSSGKMGYALAEAAQRRGATVTLISGPTALAYPTGITVLPVETAAQMRDAAMSNAPNVDIIIAAAAVADYRATEIASHKIKKSGHSQTIALEPTDDILALLGKAKSSHQILVGFAAETTDVLANADKKLSSKNLDWIVANDVTAPGAGFDFDTNIVTILGKNRERIALSLLPKREVAERIFDAILSSAKP